jgi:hypothetical protein
MIQERVDAFAQELSALIRQAAVESVEQALSGAAAPVRKKAGGRPARKATAKKARTKGAGGKRIRRSPEELEALAGTVTGFLKKNPESSLEEISAGVEIPSAELKKPIADMLAAKALKKKGQKRGTRYSVK